MVRVSQQRTRHLSARSNTHDCQQGWQVAEVSQQDVQPAPDSCGQSTCMQSSHPVPKDLILKSAACCQSTATAHQPGPATHNIHHHADQHGNSEWYARGVACKWRPSQGKPCEACGGSSSQARSVQACWRGFHRCSSSAARRQPRLQAEGGVCASRVRLRHNRAPT